MKRIIWNSNVNLSEIEMNELRDRLIVSNEDGNTTMTCMNLRSLQEQSLIHVDADRRPSRPKSKIEEKKYLSYVGIEPKEPTPTVYDNRRWFQLLFRPKNPYGRSLVKKEVEEKLEDETTFSYSSEEHPIIEKGALLIQKYIRRYKSRRKLFDLRKKRAKRRWIVREFYQTEQTFVHHLQVAEYVFIIPLKNHIISSEEEEGEGEEDEKSDKVIKQSEYDRLFRTSGYSSIRNIHQILLDFLRGEVFYSSEEEKSMKLYRVKLGNLDDYSRGVETNGEEIKDFGSIGTCLQKIAPYFKMHSKYISNYKMCIETWKKIKQRNRNIPSKHKVLLDLERNERTTCLGLISYLIIPVSRVPRYRMLLRDLIKSTNEEHPDFQMLKTSMKSIMEAADYLNTFSKSSHNLEELGNVKSTMISNPEILENAFGGSFVCRERSLVMKKYLFSEVTPGDSNLRNRVMFLHSDVLMMCEQKHEVIIEHYRNLFYEYHIPLENVKIFLCHDVDDDESQKSYNIDSNETRRNREVKIVKNKFMIVVEEDEQRTNNNINNSDQKIKKIRRRTEVFIMQKTQREFDDFIFRFYKCVNKKRKSVGLPKFYEIGEWMKEAKMDEMERKEYLLTKILTEEEKDPSDDVGYCIQDVRFTNRSGSSIRCFLSFLV